MKREHVLSSRLIFFFLLSPVLLLGHFDLSICTIFKNEAPFLKEWLEFHKLQGTQHFYLYNNRSSDSFLEVLEPYLLSGEVTLIDWDLVFRFHNHRQWLSIQRQAYIDCLKKYGGDSTWIAFLDADEFLFCPTGQILPEFLKSFLPYGAVGVNCYMFGTSEKDELPKNRCLIEILTKCCDPNSLHNRTLKVITQPKCVVGPINPHIFCLKKPYVMVDSDYQEMRLQGGTASLNAPKNDKIRINHYWTRTENWFRTHKLPSLIERKRDHWKILCPLLNEFEDISIQQFVPKLKISLGYENTNVE